LSYIESLLRDCGFDTAQAAARAVLAYSFIRVATTLIDPADKKGLENCLNLLTSQG
jgi:hypothetical protein